MVTLDGLKAYLRIDIDAEDAFLSSCLLAAGSYLTDAVTNYAAHYEADSAFAAKADMVIMALAAEMYQNRDGRNDPRKDYAYIFRSMISQLQYWAGDTS